MAEHIEMDPESVAQHGQKLEAIAQSFATEAGSFLSSMMSRDPWGEDEVSMELAAQHDELQVSADECYNSAVEALQDAGEQLQAMAQRWDESDLELSEVFKELDDLGGEVEI